MKSHNNNNCKGGTRSHFKARSLPASPLQPLLFFFSLFVISKSSGTEYRGIKIVINNKIALV